MLTDQTLEIVTAETLQTTRSQVLNDIPFNPSKAEWSPSGQYVIIQGTIPGNKGEKGAVLVLDETLQEAGVVYWQASDINVDFRVLSPNGQYLIGGDYTWYVLGNRTLSSKVKDNVAYGESNVVAWIKKVPLKL